MGTGDAAAGPFSPGLSVTRLKILSVDSDAVVSKDCILRRRGHDVRLIGTGREALELFESTDFVLLNMDLPDMDAYKLCTAMRQVSDVPIIAIVDGDDEIDRVLALRAGADDCVRKSCGFHEVVARMDAILARTNRERPGTVGSPEKSSTVVRVGDLLVDSVTRTVRVGRNPVAVTDKEFDLLAFLMTQHPTVATRRDILREVWQTEWNGASRTIDSHVSSLRSKLGSSDAILSVRGVGYRIGEVPTYAPGPRPVLSSA